MAYWHRRYLKAHRLLGMRERRIVGLMTTIHKLRSAVMRRSVKGVICSVFGAHCSEALHVAQCESNFNVYARNPAGYWGLFQFGAYARARYGFAWNAWTQTRAAFRYFLDAGWSPWTCHP